MKRIASAFLGWLLLLITAQADQPTTDQERQKAHIVSRMYQVTYGAQKQCSNYKDEITRLDRTIDRFRHAYPELMELVESSPYLPQAKDEFNEVIRKSSNQLPVEECRYMENMFHQWLENPDGQKMANDMIKTLKGNDPTQQGDKSPNHTANGVEDTVRPRSVINTQPHKPPFVVPFEAQKAGSSLMTELRVVEHRQYEFALFLKDKNGATTEDRRRLDKLAGQFGRDGFGKLVSPGISIPLKLKVSLIESSGERTIYDKEIREEEEQGGGGMGIHKLIDYIELKPGRYRVSIQSLKDIPELAENPIDFGVFARRNSNLID